MPWTVVIPVRAPGKSRLRRGPEIARAIALDTIAAAVGVADVVVVTADDEIADSASELGATVVREMEPTGIAAAIAIGLPADGRRAVLLGDLPALQPDDLRTALEAAALPERSFVSDADGTGTTLVAARAGAPFIHHFGAGSGQAHRDAGFTELPAASGLRRDVDLEEHLQQLLPHLGPRTTALLTRGDERAQSSSAPDPN